MIQKDSEIYGVFYREAKAALDRQNSSIDELRRSASGILTFGFAGSAALGGLVIRDLSVCMGTLVGLMVVVSVVFWVRVWKPRDWQFRLGVEEASIDLESRGTSDVPLALVYRDRALHIEEDWLANEAPLATMQRSVYSLVCSIATLVVVLIAATVFS